MDSVLLVQVLRAIHIVAGALWVGGVVFLAVFLIPAIGATAPAGSRVLSAIAGRKFPAYMASLPGLVLLSGIGLYARNSMLSHGAWARTASGMTFGLGAVLAIIGGVIGGAVAGRTAEKLEIAGRTAPQDAAALAEMQRLQNKVAAASKLAAGLLLAATVAMAVGRYI